MSFPGFPTNYYTLKDQVGPVRLRQPMRILVERMPDKARAWHKDTGYEAVGKDDHDALGKLLDEMRITHLFYTQFPTQLNRRHRKKAAALAKYFF